MGVIVAHALGTLRGQAIWTAVDGSIISLAARTRRTAAEALSSTAAIVRIEATAIRVCSVLFAHIAKARVR